MDLPELAAPSVPPRPHCEPPDPASAAQRVELDAQVLVAAPVGPRVRDRAWSTTPREASQVTDEVVESHGRELNACYRWARSRDPALAGTVQVVLAIDEWGRASSVETHASQPELERLAECASDVLSGLALSRFEPRRTVARLTLSFERSGLGRPSNVSRPRRDSSNRRAGSCTEVPVDELTVASAISIKDWDQAQAIAEEEARYREALRACRKAHCHGLPGRRGVAPEVIPGTVRVKIHLTKELVQRRLRDNLGSYQACWAEAVQRGAAAPAQVRIIAEFHRSGIAHGVHVAGADPALARCLSAAVAEVWLPRGDADVHIEWPLTLGAAPSRVRGPASDTVEGIERRAAAALDLGDGAAALRHYGALLSQRPRDERACRWQIGLLTGLEKVAPWGDERALAVIERLGRNLSARPDQACLKDAFALISQMPLIAHKEAQQTLDATTYEIAAERYRRILLAMPPTDGTWQLEFYFAELLYVIGSFGDEKRACDAAEQYDAVLAKNTLDATLRRAASYAAVVSWKRCADVRGRTDADDRLKRAGERWRAIEQAAAQSPPRD
jgi:hypothetical protein